MTETEAEAQDTGVVSIDIDNADDRNVRQRQETERYAPFLERVPMLIKNIKVFQGANSMRSRQLGPNSKFISLQDYIVSGGRHGTIMICMILSISTSSNQTQIAQKSYNGVRGSTSTVRHSRKITVMCLRSSSGKNTAVILQGNGLSPRLFEDIETRDNGHIRPGAIIGLVNLSGTEKYLPNGTTPILTPTRPLLVLNDNFKVPESPIVMEGTSINGFMLHNCKVEVQSFRVLDTPCGGDLCDQQQLFDNEVMMNRCACFQMKSRVGLAVVVFDINVRLSNGTSFNAQLSSKYFNKTFIFNGSIPVGIRAVNLEDYEVEDRIYNTANKVFNLINTMAGGFMVSGWTKRGEVQDQAVDQPGNGLPHNAPRMMVQAGTLNHHITRLDPMKPQNVNLDSLRGFKIDVLTGLRPSE